MKRKKREDGKRRGERVKDAMQKGVQTLEIKISGIQIPTDDMTNLAPDRM